MKNLFERLPEVRGRYTENFDLGAKSWFGCGGHSEIAFKPKDYNDLERFLLNCPEEIPVHIFGALSNCIIRDGGVTGVTIRLGRAFSKIDVDNNKIICGALALDSNVANVAADHGLAGLEFFSGIPGSIGGAIKMNAGCYGSETKDVLIECKGIDRKGNLITLTPKDLKMTYRHTTLPDDVILIEATFRGTEDNPEIVKKRILDIQKSRQESQPIREKTGGSTFTNPSEEELKKADLPIETKVWQLIDQVGGRGLRVGGAQMSEKHCNFMINMSNATASDLEELGEIIKERVFDKFGIALQWEIKRIGEN
ncbi:MAG: UDP-N-acetylmuramate dehydrogenase [Pseudomonadota bacterium]